jgi:hypothetical protein
VAVVGWTAAPVQRAGPWRSAVMAGALSLLALLGAGCAPAWSAPVESAAAPPGTTVIDFEDYPRVCPASRGIADCYLPKGVSIEGGSVVDFLRDRKPPVPVGGTKAIESCSVQTNPRCNGRISMTFTTPVIRVAMRVGHSTDLVAFITKSCPGAEVDYGEIALTAFADSGQVGQNSVKVSARCQVVPAFFRPLGEPGLAGRVDVESPTGMITRVEVGWSNPKLTEPMIVDDLEFQPAASELAVSPDRLDLGEVAVSGTGASAESAVRNVGNVPVAIEAVEVSGANEADFKVGGDCVGRTLLPAASCRVVVTFAASGGGRRTATLTVVTASGTSRTATLVGAGVVVPTPWRLPLAAGLALLALMALFVILGVVLLARRLTRGRRARNGAIQPVSSRVWVQPGPVTETIRMSGPDVAVSVAFDPTTGVATWTARRPR